MGLDALLARLAGHGEAVTSVTPPPKADVTAKPAPLLARTSVTSVTSQGRVTSGAARSAQWSLHFAEAESLTVTFVPAATHAEVFRRYPDALAAEPVVEPLPVAMPAELAAKVRRCCEVGLYGVEDTEMLVAMYSTDADGTGVLVEAMHRLIGRCVHCTHFRRPGMSGGYCTRRADLPHAYGFMHFLPLGTGALCDHFKDAT